MRTQRLCVNCGNEPKNCFCSLPKYIDVAAPSGHAAGADSVQRVARCGQRHYLKTWPEYFQAITTGAKTFEARKDDRNFQTGDVLELHEFEPGKGWTNAEPVVRNVTYILRGPAFGVEAGWCVMALSAPSAAG